MILPIVLGYQGGVVEYQTEHGLVRLRGFNSVKADLVAGTVEASGKNHPMVVEDSGAGITFSGNTLTVKLTRLPSGLYSLLEARVSGGAKVTGDSAIPTAKVQPAERTKWMVTSEEVDYSVQDAKGVLSAPGEIDYALDTQSAEYVQAIDIKAASGSFSMRPLVEGTGLDPAAAQLIGPVHVQVDRTEGPRQSKVEATAGQLDIDFQAAPGIVFTLSKSVNATLDTSRPRLPSESNLPDPVTVHVKGGGDRGTITFDRVTRQPINYEFFGGPAETRIRPGANL